MDSASPQNQSQSQLQAPIVLDRFSPYTGTCYNKNYKDALYGFLSQFQDSFFYANVIQFIVVTLIYLNIGKGKYWHVLFFASLAGFAGGLLENITVAFICTDKSSSSKTIFVDFLINEIFWSTSQYAIPILNLIKMNALSDRKIAKIIKYIIIALFLPFLYFRGKIGYERMKRGYLMDKEISNIHLYSFCVLAVADFICTISILYFISKHNKQLVSNTSNVIHRIKQSTTVLITIDIIGFFLSLIYIAVISEFTTIIPTTITVPFQCLMSNFILILSIDALLFKYDANKNASSLQSTTEASRHTYVNNTTNNNDFTKVKMNESGSYIISVNGNYNSTYNSYNSNSNRGYKMLNEINKDTSMSNISFMNNNNIQ